MHPALHAEGSGLVNEIRELEGLYNNYVDVHHQPFQPLGSFQESLAPLPLAMMSLLCELVGRREAVLHSTCPVEHSSSPHYRRAGLSRDRSPQ